MDLALNNQRNLICHKTQTTNQPTDCFIVSQLFSVARSARCLSLGWKPGWLYISQAFYLRAIVILSVSNGIFYLYFSTYTLSATWSTQFLRRALPYNIRLSWYIYVYIYIYIYIHIYLSASIMCVCGSVWLRLYVHILELIIMIIIMMMCQEKKEEEDLPTSMIV